MEEERLGLDSLVPELDFVHRWERRERFVASGKRHPNWLIFAAERGEFSYRIGAEEGVAAFGDLVLCPPDRRFDRTVICPVSLFVIQLGWKDASGDAPDEALLQAIPSGKVAPRDVSRLASTYRMLQDSWPQREARSIRRTQHYVADLWLQVCDALHPVRAASPGGVSTVMAQARRQLEMRAFEPLRLQALAEECGMSLSVFSRRYKQAWGCPPLAQLTALRMERAMQLLAETELPLEAIALGCGYQSGFYLSRLFRRITGQTPGQYRQQRRI
ncbi:helix-turn-helix transcriptional regulator [Paenibacillus sp. IB182496]|uniref:Helix-turn-helix transcriptional regulator n=1 Tax=Paenibacillus sabuli TaxID=2772509 RepID=A0A927BYB4_9BACL|nr:AraC family transcriptional regulator [Paenibacillus sabuli]MBD2848602.1 helix-turn-helix transcriptional regulator [Paenibacillus sabuli]